MLPKCILWMIRLCILIVRGIMAPLIRIRWLLPPRRLPPMENKLLEYSATRLAHMIRTRQITSEQVVSAYIKRIQDVNPLLNAVVQARFTEALEDAKMVDRIVKSNSAEDLAEKYPFLGIPLTVKESIAVKGLSDACGQLKYRGHIATKDADSVHLMREAGAIVLLVSNCPELCMSYETYNKVTGTTNNPYDLRRTSGGSSGGEAALLGAGASVIGLASDIGGSSRIPAMFTGVYGHKPSSGVVSFIGHTPIATDENWYRHFTVSPMVRYSEDLRPVLKVIAGDNAQKLQLDKEVNIQDLKVFYMEDDGGSIITSQVHPDVKKAMKKVLNYYETTYHIHPKELKIKDLKYALELTFATLLRLQGVTSIFQEESDPMKWKSVTLEFIKYFLCLSPHNFPQIVYGLIYKIANKIPEHSMKQIQKIVNQLHNTFKTLLGENGVFIYPTFVDPAGFHLEMYYKLLDCTYSTIFNVLELPATNCPVGLSCNGLPVSIQVIAGPWQDRLCIRVAQELEKAFGGWVPPPDN